MVQSCTIPPSSFIKQAIREPSGELRSQQMIQNEAAGRWFMVFQVFQRASFRGPFNSVAEEK